VVIRSENQFSVQLEKGTDHARLESEIKEIRTWNPERPVTFMCLNFVLSENDKIIHQVSERFGFRTVEVRETRTGSMSMG
jgi:beta-galactosidase/beta-glucuronidase